MLDFSECSTRSLQNTYKFVELFKKVFLWQLLVIWELSSKLVKNKLFGRNLNLIATAVLGLKICKGRCDDKILVPLLRIISVVKKYPFHLKKRRNLRHCQVI